MKLLNDTELTALKTAILAEAQAAHTIQIESAQREIDGLRAVIRAHAQWSAMRVDTIRRWRQAAVFMLFVAIGSLAVNILLISSR